MKWNATGQVGMVYFMESAAFGEMTTFLHMIQFGKRDLRCQKTQCPCVQIFQLGQCHRAVCHLVDFYPTSRLIHLWTSMKYFTHKINLSVKLRTTEHSSVYNESVFSTITSTQ